METRQPGHVPALDGVRGLAIAIVVVHNAGFILHENRAFLPRLSSAITATGWIGVQLFFVLSGFLITGILLKARGSERFFRTFYLRRTLRIFPLYYAFLAVTLVIVPLVFGPQAWPHVTSENRWWYWTYTSNWGDSFGHGVAGLTHFWSLAVEEQFYLCWPLLVHRLRPRSLVAVCLAALVTMPFVRLAMRLSGLPVLTAYELGRWDALAAGALLAVMAMNQPGRDWLRRAMPWVGRITLIAWTLFLLINRGFHENDIWVQTLGQSIVAVASCVLLWSVTQPAAPFSHALNRAISAPWLRFLGKYSYAIYVFHVPIHRGMDAVFSRAINSGEGNVPLLKVLPYLAAVAGLSVLAALLSWRLVEKPFLDLKDRLALYAK